MKRALIIATVAALGAVAVAAPAEARGGFGGRNPGFLVSVLRVIALRRPALLGLQGAAMAPA
jgi:hypothetical protein